MNFLAQIFWIAFWLVALIMNVLVIIGLAVVGAAFLWLVLGLIGGSFG